MKLFKSFEEYERWAETFENCSDYEEIPTAIDDGWKISVDMFTECKSWKTALRRFSKTFAPVSDGVAEWATCIRESCENGCFSDVCRPAWTNDPEEVKKFLKGGAYSWGVEETMPGYWYIYLNISGVYAGREA